MGPFLWNYLLLIQVAQNVFVDSSAPRIGRRIFFKFIRILSSLRWNRLGNSISGNKSGSGILLSDPLFQTSPYNFFPFFKRVLKMFLLISRLPEQVEGFIFFKFIRILCSLRWNRLGNSTSGNKSGIWNLLIFESLCSGALHRLVPCAYLHAGR